MDKKAKIALISSLVIAGILAIGLAMASHQQRQCRDGIDNDGDTRIDYPNDPGCSSKNDNSELGTVQCDDGVDNDGDTKVDYPDDLGCIGPSDNDETNCGDSICEGEETFGTCPQDCPAPVVACNDGVDNDGDSHIDTTVTGDSKCVDSSDNDESPRDFCSNTDAGIFEQQIQGTVSGEDNSIPFSNTDFCINSTWLREYYCGSKSEDYNGLFVDEPCLPLANATNTSGFCVSGACI